MEVVIVSRRSLHTRSIPTAQSKMDILVVKMLAVIRHTISLLNADISFSQLVGMLTVTLIQVLELAFTFVRKLACDKPLKLLS